ncbi:MAG: Asp23/Gls24 family envelope stress response protein [Candidatus Promineifilaceae bacterium]|nr:Asp23/Gls24 family envelope stress response protein [Candidatus Promineifilaceae bacterium]
MSEERESIGRIEVAPEVLATIAHFAALRVEGVSAMAPIPPHIARMFRRATRQDGVVMDLSDNEIKFNIYLIMEPQASVLETSRKVQSAVSESINTLVGVSVDAVNVHVEDVVYKQGEVF